MTPAHHRRAAGVSAAPGAHSATAPNLSVAANAPVQGTKARAADAARPPSEGNDI